MVSGLFSLQAISFYFSKIMLKVIKSENFNKPVKEQETWNFDIEIDGVYLIVISARCRNWLQNFKLLFNDDDLAVQIDDYLFAEIKGKKREFSSAGSWNGNELKNSSKKVLFVLPLKTGMHKIVFWTDGLPVLEKIDVYQQDFKEIALPASDISGIKNFDVVIKDLAIEKLLIKAKADADSKLELRVDGNIQVNQKYKRYKKWYWYGKELRGKSKEFALDRCWTNGIHSLEFYGEGKPQIELIQIKIGGDRLKYKIGRVRLWKDIVISDVVNLRSEHNQNSEILANLKDGDELEIINERVVGDYINNLSEIWHEVIYQDKRGFILSSFVEIEGQEREKIIDLIKEKCWQYDVDANVMLAIAGCESHFKPYAFSIEKRQGIFQLGPGAVKDMDVVDPYDVYQNTEGGVKYYKWIQKQIGGRRDVLEKRLVAWHAGIDYVRGEKHINYSEMPSSGETRRFVKNVLENVKKRDWYHIISLSILILVIVSGCFVGQLVLRDKMEMASNMSSYIREIFTSEPDNVIDNLNPQIVDYQQIYPGNRVSSFPAVFWEEKENKIVFLNSKKKIVQKIDAGLLNLDKIFQTPLDFQGPNGQNSIHIDSEVLENPENVFYFLAATTFSCGVNNCTWILYRFNAVNNNLEILDKNIFGEVTNFYLSPDSQKLAFVSNVHGGFCNSRDYLVIIDLSNFKKEKVKNYIDNTFNTIYITNFSWKNNQEIEFGVDYDADCTDFKSIEKDWMYNTESGKIKQLKMDIVNHEI